MTDFMPCSGAAGSSDNAALSLASERARPALAPRGTAAPTPAHSAAALGAAVHQLLHAIAGKRVPQLDRVRQRLQQFESSWALPELGRAMRKLQEAGGGIDFLAARGGTACAGAFRSQGAAVAAAARRLGSASIAFVGRHAADAAVARLLWIELQIEYRGLEKRVRQGLQWMVDMEHDLAVRQAAATAEVSRQALQELARRARAMEDRLHRVHGLCATARAARTLGEQVGAQRSALSRTLQDKVRPRSVRLLHRLQPLVDASPARPLQAGELLVAIDAQHELQVALTHAAADLLHLQSLQHELATQLAAMEEKAAQLA